MSLRRLTFTSVAIAIALSIGGWIFHLREAAAATARRTIAAAARLASERQQLDESLAAFIRSTEIDPASAFFKARVATLYLGRARSTGDYSDILSAEESARASLAIREEHNEEASISLAASLIGQHRFAEAAVIARDVVDRDPDSLEHQALLGEILLELGDYEGARPIFRRLGKNRIALSWAPRYARWLELTGHADGARRIIRDAGEQAIGLDHLPREVIAWYYLRMGDLEFRDGGVNRAKLAYTEGLSVAPDDYRLLSARARLFSSIGEWKRAAADAEASLATVLDPAPLAVLSDAYRALGDSSKAQQADAALEVAFLHQPGPFHRAMSLFLLDHGRHVAAVLEKAQTEIATRRDPYGYDVLAWALHASGRDVEALAAGDSALARGTEDAIIFYHIGMIERSLGRNAAAARHLTRALEINPHFHPAHPAGARAVLDSIERHRSAFSQ